MQIKFILIIFLIIDKNRRFFFLFPFFHVIIFTVS